MRIIEPHQFQKPLSKKRPIKWLLLVVVAILLASYGGIAYVKPVPMVVGQPVSLAVPSFEAPALSWPSTGQAAFGADGFGVLAQSGAQTTAPMASVAKVLTALAVLQAKPLKNGEPGPTLTIGAEDIDAYNKYVALGGSVVPINSGETLTEYQALEAMLLPSANNMADTLARWAYGSTGKFIEKANQLALSFQLTQTHLADASGFSQLTKSTPRDLVTLGTLALKHPVLAEIVQQKRASIPVAGEVFNTNQLLGLSGINGIKTGHTDEAGGCLLFSTTQAIGSQKLILVGAVMGASSLTQASTGALALLRSAVPGFREMIIVQKQTIAGNYKTSWGSSASAVVSNEVSMVVWATQAPHLKVSLNEVKAPVLKNSVVGSLIIDGLQHDQTVPVKLEQSLSAPDFKWRLTHFLNN